MEQRLLEFLGGGAFAFLVIKEVLKFIKLRQANGSASADADKWKFELLELQSKQTSVLMRQSDILGDIKNTVSGSADKLNTVSNQLTLAMERQQMIARDVQDMKQS